MKKTLLLSLALLSSSSFAYTQDEINKAFIPLIQKCSMAYTMAISDPKNIKDIETILKEYEGLTTTNGDNLTTFCHTQGMNVVKNTYRSDQKNSKGQVGGDRVEKAINAWGNQYPESVYAKLALADLYTNKAWLSRGDGYVGNISESGLQGFQENMKQADDLLNKISDKNTFWYILKLETTAITNPVDFFPKALSAMQKYPMERDIYNTIVNYASAKWLGEPNNQTIEDLGQFAVKNFPYQQGKISYTQLYLALGEFNLRIPENNPCPACKTNINPPLMNKKIEQEGTEMILKKHPSDFNKVLFFKIACMRDNNKTMKSLYPQVKDFVEIPEHRVKRYFQTEEWHSCLDKAKNG